jgi:myosin heavy subunit
MDETTGTEIAASTEAFESSGPVETAEAPAESTSGNPAWESVRTKLDPVSFHAIEDELKKWDKNAESRISSLNQQLKSYADLGSPEQLQNYVAIAQKLDTEPEVVYDALGQFLKQNGRLPQTEQELQDAVDEQEESENVVDPRLAQLEQQQEQMRQFLEQQEMMRIQQEADATLDQEIAELRAAQPDFSEDDIKEILMRAAFQLQSGNKAVKLADVANEYLEKTVNRIRAVPRPGDSAPRLLPTSGGVPGGQQSKSLGKLSRNEVQDFIAASLQQGR